MNLPLKHAYKPGWRSFTPLEMMPRCFAAGVGPDMVPAGFDTPLGFESQRLEFLTGFTRALPDRREL